MILILQTDHLNDLNLWQARGFSGIQRRRLIFNVARSSCFSASTVPLGTSAACEEMLLTNNTQHVTETVSASFPLTDIKIDA